MIFQVIILSTAFLVNANITHAEQILSVRELENVKKSWPLFADNKTNFTVRGLVGSRAGKQVHMRNSKLPFVMESSGQFPRLNPGERVIRMSGHFARDGKKIIFKVNSIRSDFKLSQIHRQKTFDIDRTDPEAWRKLAQYTASESKFYEDDELFELAVEAFVYSYQVERAQLGLKASQHFGAWIDEMKEFGVPSRITDSWVHHHYRIRWEEILDSRKFDREAVLSLAAEIAKAYPASLIPLEVPVPNLSRSYEKEPVKVFQELGQEQRGRLWRLFYIQIMRKEIISQAADDGSNAKRIHDLLIDGLPDEPQLIKEYDEKWLAHRSSRLKEASRDEAIDLAREYRSRKQSEQAQVTLEVWLEGRLAIWKKEGAGGLVRAAKEYELLLDDRDKAYELLSQAWRQSPGEEETRKALEALGYRLSSGRWITASQFSKLPRNPIDVAIQEGKVIPGMTPSDVLRAIGSSDDQRISFSANQISVAWIYGQSSTTQLVVHFLRPAGSEPDLNRVIGIGEWRRNSITTIRSSDDSDDKLE